MLEWKQWLNWADQYRNSGTPKPGGRRRLSPVIIYNLYSMALENYAMAILARKNRLPENHTFTDLVNGLEEIMDFDPRLKARILDLEQYQQLCSFADFEVARVDDRVLAEFRLVLDEFSALAHQD
jgi:hypothetical protein